VRKTRLKLADLVVSSFETQPAAQYDSGAGTGDVTPDTHCFVCGHTDASCDAICAQQAGGGGA
jgi:hypothetical protein